MFLALSPRFKYTLVDLVNIRYNFFIANREYFKWIGIEGVGEIIKELVFVGDTNRLGENT